MSEQFIKLLIIGDSGVGKSCILSRFCENKFTQAFYNTIGVDFKTKTIMLEGKKCKLQIWDTAGQERFRTITANYYKGAHGILVVYDVTQKQSFQNLAFWLDQIQKHSNSQSTAILIGNKADLQKRKVSQDEGYEFAKKNKLEFIQSSAYSAANINLVFQTIAKKVLRQRTKKQTQALETPLAKKNSHKLEDSQANKKNKKDSNCC